MGEAMSAQSIRAFRERFPERAAAVDPISARLRRQAARLREKAQGMLAQANELEELAAELEQGRR